MGLQHKVGTVQKAATEGQRGQKDAVKGLPGKRQYQKARQDRRSARKDLKDGGLCTA